MTVKPVLLVSECLGFKACRYNAQMVGNRLVDQLVSMTDICTVCPEVAIGLDVPREPVRLVRSPGDKGDLRLVQPSVDKDLTVAMTKFSQRYLATLPELDGAILKARSPSCGVRDAKRYASAEKGPSVGRGAGLFAAALLERFPDAAIEDEGRLSNFRIREHFLTKLFLRARFRNLRDHPSRGALVQFHAENKFLLLAYHQAGLRALGRIVATAKQRRLQTVLADYETQLSRSLARPPRNQAQINVLQHALGYVSGGLASQEKAHFLSVLARFKERKLPLSAPISIVRSWIARFDSSYLAQQSFFHPYPESLLETTDSGTGREIRA